MNTAKLNFVSAVAVLAIAGAALYGWAAQLDILTRLVPASEKMKANTAIGLGLLGFRLLILTGCLVERRGPLTVASRLAAGAAALIGAWTLLEYILGMDLGIDQLFVRDVNDVTHPGRTALPTAIAFTVMGAALSLPREWRGPRLTTGVTWLLFAAAVCGIVDYAFTASAHTEMALPTGIALLLAGINVATLPKPESAPANA
jgi:hypothetical protein